MLRFVRHYVGILASMLKSKKRIGNGRTQGTYDINPNSSTFDFTIRCVHIHPWSSIASGDSPGGTTIALGILLLMLSNNEFKVTDVAKHVEQSAGAGYVVIGLMGIMAIGGVFLINFSYQLVLLGILFSACAADCLLSFICF